MLQLLRSPWLHPLNDVGAIDDLLAQLHPTWAFGRIRARVVATRDETPDVRSVLLRPNRRWPGFAAGQHVTLVLAIDGVRHARAFSLSSAPGDPLLRLTVRRNPAGRVSNAVHDRLAAGDVVELGAPAGAFVLPAVLPERMLLLSAGSGITPLMAMLRDLARRDPARDVVFLHAHRSARDAIFAGELAALATAMPGLRLVAHRSAECGRLDPDGLAALVPDFRERRTWLCGPASFRAMVEAHWAAEGIGERLACERFTGPAPRARAAGAPVRVHATRSGRSFETTGERSLLVEAERAGLAPPHGCRIGICRTCRCRMTRGSVVDLRTGEIAAEPGRLIQLCVSAARSDLEIEL